MSDSIFFLKSISPIDGRYHNKTSELSNYFSEFALIKYRVFIEIQYFIELSNTDIKIFQSLTNNDKKNIESIYDNFCLEDAVRIKELEKEINHDVKAVEYFIKMKFDELKLSKFKEFIHFGLTSQDVNNTAVPLMLKDSMDNVISLCYKKSVSYTHLTLPTSPKV